MEHLNKVIKMLSQGEIPINCIPIRNGDESLAQTYGDADIDMVIFEMEHQSFTFDGLQSSLQHLLNRQRIAEDGLMPSVTPVVRIPTSGSEVNEWMIKQALDQGVYGIVVPRLESGEQVRKTVEGLCAIPPGAVRRWAAAAVATLLSSAHAIGGCPSPNMYSARICGRLTQRGI